MRTHRPPRCRGELLRPRSPGSCSWRSRAVCGYCSCVGPPAAGRPGRDDGTAADRIQASVGVVAGVRVRAARLRVGVLHRPPPGPTKTGLRERRRDRVADRNDTGGRSKADIDTRAILPDHPGAIVRTATPTSPTPCTPGTAPSYSETDRRPLLAGDRPADRELAAHRLPTSAAEVGEELAGAAGGAPPVPPRCDTPRSRHPGRSPARAARGRPPSRAGRP